MFYLIHDVLSSFKNLWISLWEGIISKVDKDIVYLWGDISDSKGFMMFPAIFIEFMTHYYKKIKEILKEKEN